MALPVTAIAVNVPSASVGNEGTVRSLLANCTPMASCGTWFCTFCACIGLLSKLR